MNEKPLHVHLQRSCGACGDEFGSGEAFVAVLPNDDSIKIIGSYGFPVGHNELSALNKKHGDLFTHRPACPPDSTAKCEGATIHADCFNLFRRNCKNDNRLQLLLLASLWKLPWRDASTFRLKAIDVLKVMNMAARACSMPMLKSMPHELTSMMWENAFHPPSGSAVLVLRYLSVLSLAAACSDLEFDKEICLSLSKVASWERGSRPVEEEKEADASSTIRITIDGRGLKKIERLVQRPEIRHQRTDSELYVLEIQEKLEGVEVQFQAGLARLKLPKNDLELRTWDTPTPPPVEDLTHRTWFSKIFHFATIDTTSITGLTFFMSRKTTRIAAIHQHTSWEPDAIPTWNQLPPHQQASMNWLYVPFPAYDRLTACGLRFIDGSEWRLMLRFEKSGDYVVGPHTHTRRLNSLIEDTIWPVVDQLSLVSSLSQSGSVIAMDGFPGKHDPTQRPFVEVSIRGLPPVFGRSFITTAPLEDVHRLRVFTDVQLGTFRGLILEYQNGAQRSIGECRMGMDKERVYRKPVSICISQEPGERRPHIKVKADCEPEHKHKADDWRCYKMRGTLRYWYAYYDSGIGVLEDDDEDDEEDPVKQ